MNTARAMPDRDPETHAIIGAALDVHNELGCGFLEGVYRAALPIEFRHRGIPFLDEVGLPIRYKGELLRLGYRVDFICFESLHGTSAHSSSTSGRRACSTDAWCTVTADE